MAILDTLLFSGIAMLILLKLALLAVAAVLLVRGVEGRIGVPAAARVRMRARYPAAGARS